MYCGMSTIHVYYCSTIHVYYFSTIRVYYFSTIHVYYFSTILSVPVEERRRGESLDDCLSLEVQIFSQRSFHI